MKKKTKNMKSKNSIKKVLILVGADDDLSPLILRYSGTVLRTELVEIGLAWTSNPLAGTRHT